MKILNLFIEKVKKKIKMNLSLEEIVTEILKDEKKAFDIALQYNILPKRYRILHCPKCRHIMVFNTNSDKWKCTNY